MRFALPSQMVLVHSLSIVGVLLLADLGMLGVAVADDYPAIAPELVQRMERLEFENQRIRQDVEHLKSVTPESSTESPLASTVLPVTREKIAYETPCDRNPFSLAWRSSSAGKYPTVKVTGFFQADAIWANQEPENMAAIVNGLPLGDIQDGADFRRARLAATGDVWENVGYMIEFDFGFPGRPSFMDVYLDVRDLPLGDLRVGQWRQPIGMDGLTSVRELTFIERALPFAFLPFRQIGAGLSDQYEELGLTWASSIFRYPTDPFGSNVGDNGGYGYAGRLTWLAMDGDNNQTLHVGGAYSFVDPANDFLRFLNQPELFVGETAGSLAPRGVPGNLPPFVDTGLIPSNSFNLAGLELAGSYGAFLAQSELLIMSVNRTADSNVNFWGAYAQVSYVLTSEARPYNKKAGVYGRVVPEEPFKPGCGCGAWEIASRWSTIELTDKDVAGNDLQDWTVGLNWYLNGNTKFQFNYIHPLLDSAVSGVSHADLFAVRAQLDF